MMNHKQVTIKLFFNRNIMRHYIQIGDYLYGIRANVAELVAEKEGLEIRYGSDIKAIQEMSLADDKNNSRAS